MEHITGEESAMIGMLANTSLLALLDKVPLEEHDKFLSEAAVEQADSMITALNKIHNPNK